jgi:uncharacterized protein (TIGR02284 family)
MYFSLGCNIDNPLPLKGNTMDQKEIISTLNDLIETSKDGEKGFQTCAEDAQDDRLKSMFSNRAQNCAIAVRELQDIVRSHGGNPANSSSMSGALHRGWLDIRSAIAGKDDVAVLNECERGEDSALRNYRAALSKDLPVDVRSVVERQYQGVLQNHDQIKSLRDQVKSARN